MKTLLACSLGQEQAVTKVTVSQVLLPRRSNCLIRPKLDLFGKNCEAVVVQILSSGDSQDTTDAPSSDSTSSLSRGTATPRLVLDQHGFSGINLGIMQCD